MRCLLLLLLACEVPTETPKPEELPPPMRLGKCHTDVHYYVGNRGVGPTYCTWEGKLWHCTHLTNWMCRAGKVLGISESPP